MYTRQVYCTIISLTLLLGSCSSDSSVTPINPINPENPGNTDQEYDDSLIPPIIQPIGVVPDNLYQESDIIHTNDYTPFTKQLTVYGIILVGRDEISDNFMRNVAQTIKEMFTSDGEHFDEQDIQK